MKRLLLILSLTALTISCAQKAQDTLPESIDDNLYRFGVNTSPYEYFNTGETPVPAGYEPFYISHYGRHGSRSDWGDDYGEVVTPPFSNLSPKSPMSPASTVLTSKNGTLAPSSQ